MVIAMVMNTKRATGIVMRWATILITMLRILISMLRILITIRMIPITTSSTMSMSVPTAPVARD